MSAYDYLGEYIKRKDYKKIHKLLLKMNKDVPTFNNVINIEHFKLAEKKKEMLKIIIKNDVQFMLLNGKGISNALLMVVQCLDNDFNNEIRSITSHVIIKRALEDIQHGMRESSSISMFNEWIAMYSAKIEELKFKYSHLPPSWNLLGEFTYNYCLYLKKVLTHALQQRNDNNDVINALKTVLKFELKVLKYCFVTYCCTEKKKAGITFHNDEIIIDGVEKKNEIVIYNENYICSHRKILSMCFVNHLNIYLLSLYNVIAKIQFDYSKIDMKIYIDLINLFKCLNDIFVQLLHFENCDILCKLVVMADAELCMCIAKIPKPQNIHMASINLNSLLYIETTFNNFLDTIYKATHTNFTSLKYPEQLRKKEKSEYAYIDKSINRLFANVKTIKNFNAGEHVYKIIQKLVFKDEYYEYFDEIVSFLIENVISVLFSVIIREKMEPSLAENVLAEITDLKRLIMIRIDKIPFLSIVERYLKIFLVDPQNTKDFLENFRNFGNANFNFSQILRMLKDDTNNVRLFMEYKKVCEEQN